MSTYELEDSIVRSFLEQPSVEAQSYISAALKEQLPIPTPTKIGAVGRTTAGIAVLADQSNKSPWVLNYPNPDDGYTWEATDSIGRITEVLSEGVDL